METIASGTGGPIAFYKARERVLAEQRFRFAITHEMNGAHDIFGTDNLEEVYALQPFKPGYNILERTEGSARNHSYAVLDKRELVKRYVERLNAAKRAALVEQMLIDYLLGNS